MKRYRTVLALEPFGRIWLGATGSLLGDSMSSVALIWLVYHRTHAASAVGWLEFTYGAPVVLGGLLTGGVFQRFGVLRTMRIDSLLRTVMVGSVPCSLLFGGPPLWLLYLVAASYGLAKMIPLAGVPTLIAEVVPSPLRDTANALEAVAYGMASIAGPFAAALIIASAGAPWVLAVDALTFATFAIALRGNSELGQYAQEPEPATVGQATRFLLEPGPVRTITVMFATFNIGFAILLVVLPIYAVKVLHAGAGTYGLLLGTLAAGELAGAIVGGLVSSRVPIGRAIAGAQVVAGIVLLGLLGRPPIELTLVILLVAGFFEGPLTVWAQTVRMAAIPPRLRGHAFSLLRTVMQGAAPIGGAVGGFLAAAGIPLAAGILSGGIAGAGAAGLASPSLSRHTLAEPEGPEREP